MQKAFCSTFCWKCEKCQAALEDLAKLEGQLQAMQEHNARIRGPHTHRDELRKAALNHRGEP
jgi:hypothetical protein